jgi:hypothetical protein
MTYHLVQMNVGRLRYPLDDERMTSFADALEPLDELAEASPTFAFRPRSPTPRPKASRPGQGQGRVQLVLGRQAKGSMS